MKQLPEIKKMNNKDWQFFQQLNSKLERWSEIYFDYTETTKVEALLFVEHAVKNKYKYCVTKEEAYINKDQLYIYKINYNDFEFIYLIISLSPSSGAPNIIPGEELNSDVNIY